MAFRYIIVILSFFYGVFPVVAQNSNRIIVSKEDMQMSVYNENGTEILRFPIACGKNFGQKQRAGDNRTPEGVFKVVSKEPASHWTYNFGNGTVAGAYGPLFIRLNTPGFKGIGIHGTHDANTVPGRETHGCVRLKNEDLLKLAKVVDKDTIVIILPSRYDVLAVMEQKNNWKEKLFLY